MFKMTVQIYCACDFYLASTSMQSGITIFFHRTHDCLHNTQISPYEHDHIIVH